MVLDRVNNNFHLINVSVFRHFFSNINKNKENVKKCKNILITLITLCLQLLITYVGNDSTKLITQN